jgi:hypothetical protein
VRAGAKIDKGVIVERRANGISGCHLLVVRRSRRWLSKNEARSASAACNPHKIDRAI